MATFQTVIDSFRTTFKDCPVTGSPSATSLLNEADEEILSVIPLRRNTIYQGFASGVMDVAVDETVIRAYEADLLYPGNARKPLEARNEADLAVAFPGWRAASGCPKYFGFTDELAAGKSFYSPIPNWSTLLVSGITNASPPVATTTTLHGLTAGSQIVLQNATGTTMAGDYYVSTPSTVNLGLYSDSALAAPIGAAGVGTAGIIGTATYPIAALHVTQRAALTAASTMPQAPQIRRLYANCMRWLWAMHKGLLSSGAWRQQFESDLAICQDMVERRAAQVEFSIMPFRQNQGFRTSGGGRG